MKNRVITAPSVEVSVKDFAKDLGLTVAYSGRGTVKLQSISVSRPGLFLSGYTAHFDDTRVEIVGHAESEYLRSMNAEKRHDLLDKLFGTRLPCLIISRGLDFIPEIYELAAKYGCPLLRSEKVTTVLINDITAYQSELLAPTEVVHGVLMDVFGIGILIIGKSGLGKSEIALELISRGHRLVSDDSVIVKNINDRLVGKSPETTRYYMEIRGIGIINIQQMFGPGSIRPSEEIDIIAELSPWEEGKNYDRIGTEDAFENMLGIDVLKVVIPVTPGRNIPVVLETAARKYRLKQAGYDPAKALMESVFGADEQ